MRGNRGIAGHTVVLVFFLLGAAIAGTVTAVLVERDTAFSSSSTLQVTPASGTGDPDRVIATQMGVLESATIERQVRTTLGAGPSFELTASQLRLANLIEVTAVSPDPYVAQVAAAAAVAEYRARAAASVLDVAVLDPPSRAARIGDPVLNTALAALGGGLLGVAVVLLFFTLTPRVRPSRLHNDLGVLVLELPHPRRRPSRRDAPMAEELRRVREQFLGGVEPAAVELVALPGVATWAFGRVRDVTQATGRLRLASGPGDQAVDTGAQGQSAPGVDVVVVLARAWVDAERSLRKEVTSLRAFSEVVVVVLGSPRVGIVPPTDDRSVSRHGVATWSQRTPPASETPAGR